MTSSDNNRPDDLCAVTQEDIRLAAICVPGAAIFADSAEHIEDMRRRAAVHIARHRLNAATDQSGEIARLRAALEDLVSWFPESGPTTWGPWIITAGALGADDAVNAARTALNTKDADR